MATAADVEIDAETNELQIQELTIHDADVVEYLSDFSGEDRREALEEALRVGVATLDLADTSKEAEFVKREFDQMQQAFEDEIEEVRDELEDKFGDDGEVSRILDEHLGEDGQLQDHLDDALGEDGKFEERLDEQLGEDGDRIQEALDPDREGTPTQRLERRLKKEIQELKEKLERQEAKEEIRQQTTKKGDDFEDVLEGHLEELVYGTNDQLERTTETEGDLDGRIVGDFVLTLGQTGQRIVIEAKSEQDTTQPDIKQELEDAIDNRDADHGIFISECESYVPNKVGYMQEFDQEMLAISVSADEDDELDPRLLQIGYNWAEMRTVQGNVDTGESLDTEVVQSKVEEVRDTLDQFQQVKKKCTTIRSNADDIEELLNDYKGDINDELNEIQAELSKAAD